ncbi:hypothetical protein BCIN_10g02780 [Botrytis cinerea B05.10]|uniref:Uncharacterized protein n=1 Tax=Botryotinia fuckeliana (strain B05.10) TaxID=332648 RepID=A0A384JUM7_BOTFB|nr:hypothetical protein BCIN_10g02780 [Botrytis cinerea B05.10]ATZ54263.1 hypothetical protein BCIN_10g02780 [Botrytis cinerea B05.10]
MKVLEPSTEALLDENARSQLLYDRYHQLAAIDIRKSQGLVLYKQEIEKIEVQKPIYYKRINQMRERLFGSLDDDQKVLGPIQVSQGDIKVTLGTENDQKNIDNAWEEYMKHEINGLVAKDAHTASADEGQRKKLLKDIEIFRGFGWAEESHGNISACDPESADSASDKMASHNIKLENTKGKLRHTQEDNASLVAAEAEKTREVKNALVSAQSMLIQANKRVALLEFTLNNKNHPMHDVLTFSFAISLRFFNLSTRHNNFGNFTPIPERGITDVGAIDRGSAAAHSGNVRAHAYMIIKDSNGLFKNCGEIFKAHYAVTHEEVFQSKFDKYSMDSKNTEIANYRGSMVHCMSFSKLTHDSNGDNRFETLRKQCEVKYQSHLKNSASAAEAQKKFDSDGSVGGMVIEMKKISKHIAWLERKRIKAQFSESDSYIDSDSD